LRLLIFGGWGQLGTDLTEAALARGHEVTRPAHDDMDVSDEVGVAGVVRSERPDAVVNAAAFHKTEGCEEQPWRAFEVNALGALNVARAAGASGARAVFVSSDYVFDGMKKNGYWEDDAVDPVNVYGVSKVAGERLTMLGCPTGLVVRGSGLFGHAGSSGKGGNFVETMLAKAAAGERITVVDDVRFSPTSTAEMAERMVLLLEKDAPAGVYHLANAGSTSWFGFAQEIFRQQGADVDLAPRTSEGDAVRRPASSALLDRKTEGLGLPPAKPWQDALSHYLSGRSGKASVG
jgi:dTDP-4-dehydrorhamnose reductase